MSNVHRIVSKLLLLVMAAIAVAPCVAAGQDQKQPLRFLGNQAIAPFISLKHGKPTGIVVDLAHALADKVGLSIAVEAMDWPVAQSEVLQGKADALLQINPDPQREQIYDFSDTLLVSNFQIFRKATRTDIQSLESLRGKKVGVESGGFPAQQLGGAGEFQLVAVPSWKAAFTLLSTDQIDAVIVDRWVGQYELAVNRSEGITLVDPPVVQNYSRIAVKKGNKKLLDKINTGLKSIKQDGTYQLIMEKRQSKEVLYFTKQFLDRLRVFAVVTCWAILVGISIRIFTYARTLRNINIKLADENAARRAAEIELAASHRDLERLVELRTTELRRSEERLRLFIDRAPAAIAMFDDEMRYLAVSRRYLEDYGLGDLAGPQVLVGRNHYEVFPQMPARLREVHRRVLAGETLADEDEPFPRQDGGTDWVRWQMVPWYRADGTVGGALLFTEVVTARKQAEEVLRESEARLRDLNRNLEERVREEVSAREEAQTRAAHAQRMQALGQLAGGIAHDFNNILQAVQGGTTLITNHSADPASVKKFAAMVLGAAERGGAITYRLLAFARRGELRAERIDPAGLLDGLRDILAQTLGSPITVHIKNDATRLPTVMADRGQLETVLVNLATNARDAMPGGGTLTFGAAAEDVPAGQLHPARLEPGQYVRVSVTDTGTGMDRATLARATEPFFTTKPQDKGTGLGLPMAKGFAEQSGGALAIDSAPGRGTTVTLWLPVADELQQAAQVQPWLAPVVGLARRVLVVDDEDLVRETLVVTLEDAGFVVLAAGSGAEALALLEAKEPVDALVSDMSMPGMDGLALIRQVHALRPGLPAILLTGFAGEARELATGAASRPFSLLRKPVTVAQLIDRIEAILAARAQKTGTTD